MKSAFAPVVVALLEPDTGRACCRRGPSPRRRRAPGCSRPGRHRCCHAPFHPWASQVSRPVLRPWPSSCSKSAAALSWSPWARKRLPRQVKATAFLGIRPSPGVRHPANRHSPGRTFFFVRPVVAANCQGIDKIWVQRQRLLGVSQRVVQLALEQMAIAAIEVRGVQPGVKASRRRRKLPAPRRVLRAEASRGRRCFGTRPSHWSWAVCPMFSRIFPRQTPTTRPGSTSAASEGAGESHRYSDQVASPAASSYFLRRRGRDGLRRGGECARVRRLRRKKPEEGRPARKEHERQRPAFPRPSKSATPR